MPEVSVIIPTFNRAHLVKKAISSVLGQTYRDLEVIIVDDFSKDNTSEIISEIKDERLKYVKHAQQKGASEARNTGVAASNGTYLAFLDDDDEWFPEKLQLQMDLFQEKPETGMIYTGYFYIDAKSKKTIREFKPKKKGFLDDQLLEKNCVGTTSTAVIKRECFIAVGGFDNKLRGCQDWDLWIRLAKQYPIDFIAKPLVNFLIHEVRITNDLKAKIQGKENLIEKLLPDIQGKPKILSNHYFVIGYLYCTKGDVETGRKKIFEAIKTYPFDLNYYKYYIPSLFGASFYKFLSLRKKKYVSLQ